MDLSLLILLLGLVFYVAPTGAVTLFSAHSDGNVSTLAFERHSGNYSLIVTSVTPDCAGNPSWLTLDRNDRLLYCLDRGATNATAGSLNSFTIGANGVLKRIARVAAPLSGVYGRLISSSGRTRGYVSASFNKSAIAAFIAPVNGSLEGPVEQINPTIPQPGPVTAQQDLSYVHEVLRDPEERFVLANDIGGDMVRVFSYDADAAVPLVQIDELHTDPGVGPRHGVFWRSPLGKWFYFFVGALDQQVHSYSIEYTKTSIAWKKVFEMPALGYKDPPPLLTAPTSEIVLSPDQRFVIVSNRDVSYPNSTKYRSGPTDTMSTFSINHDGTLDLIQLAPSGGWQPRQFSINKAGDKLAIGHQNNQTVVIWMRDLVSGKIIPEENGGKLAMITLTGTVVCTIWDE